MYRAMTRRQPNVTRRTPYRCLMHRLAVLALVLVVACSPAVPAPATTTSTVPTVQPSTAVTTTTIPLPPAPTGQLIPRTVWLFPGPEVFAGDVLTAQVPLDSFSANDLVSSSLYLDGEQLPQSGSLSGDPLLGDYVMFVEAIDTTGLAGNHSVEVRATVDGEELVVNQTFTVLPASERPPQENSAKWISVETACCTMHMLSSSAAARDADRLVAIADAGTAEVEQRFGLPMQRIDLVLLDVLWGNGGYAGGEVAISYLDRDFGPRTADTLSLTFVHELTHAAARAVDGPSTPWPLNEAMAVYVTGGHFKEQPLAARAKALDELGLLLPLDEFMTEFASLQHEARYVQAGALATFVVDEYGWDTWLELYGSTVDEPSWSGWLDAAAAQVLGLGLDELDTEFRSWVASQDPGGQVEDLRQTIALQTLRRTYQAKFAPYPNYFVYESVLDVPQPSSALREASDPLYTAVEAYIAYAQHLVLEHRLAEAAPVIDDLANIIETGEVRGPHVTPFLELALAAHDAGYELLAFDPVTGKGTVTRVEPQLESVVATVVDGRLIDWQLISSVTN